MLIRDFRIGDEAALRSVFFSSVHELTAKDYSPEQRTAWAPPAYDESEWAARMLGIRPFVAELHGRVVGYADLQPSGQIDHFFVAAPFAGCGIGGALMGHLHRCADERKIVELWSDVSLTAEPFFAKRGFVVEARKTVQIRGVAMTNARMRKHLRGPVGAKPSAPR
jgi:putative acetyltransferase